MCFWSSMRTKAQSGDEMRITWYEIKKAITSPIVIILLMLFIAFNAFQVISQSHVKEELKVVNDITNTYGNAITEDDLEQMQEVMLEDVKQLGAEQDFQTYLEEMTYEKYEEASAEEQKAIDQLSLKSMYYGLGTDVEARYTAINMDDLRGDLFAASTMNGRLAEFMDRQFTGWENRYDEIVETGEYKEWFFAGEYRMHSELFRSLVKNIAVQSLLLIAMATALIASYEAEQRTQSIMYTTKKGRKLIWHKFLASLIAAVLLFLVLAGVSLGMFFAVYDFSNVWNTPVSSGLNWEYKLPYITWWPFTVGQFLILAVITELFVILIVSILTFTLSVYIKNSYFTWILCMALLVALFILPSVLTAFPWLQFFTSLNITWLLLNPHMYFTGGTDVMMIQYFELWSILLGLMITLLFNSLAIRRFFKKDVA